MSPMRPICHQMTSIKADSIKYMSFDDKMAPCLEKYAANAFILFIDKQTGKHFRY